jgi:hypothetical protein
MNRTVAEEIADLRVSDVSALVARYEDVFGRPPRVKHREFLWKRLAWKIQEQRFGGLSAAAKRRLEDLMVEIDLPVEDRTRTITGRLVDPKGRSPLPVGTTITREWRCQQISVRVVEGGFEWNGVRYRSLSGVAKAITGTHWNARVFFKLDEGRKK